MKCSGSKGSKEPNHCGGAPAGELQVFEKEIKDILSSSGHALFK
jgi:hypothetical protein